MQREHDRRRVGAGQVELLEALLDEQRERSRSGPAILPDTTLTAPNSPSARAVASTTP